MPRGKPITKLKIVNADLKEIVSNKQQTASNPRKAVTSEDRYPVSNRGNTNYIDLRGDKTIKGANVLYSEGDDRPLDDGERKKAGLVVENGKRAKNVPVITTKQLTEEPLRGSEIEDTWSMQGFTYYGFMVGGRYNRFGTFDEVLFRDYGILLPRAMPGHVYFNEIVDDDDDDDAVDGEKNVRFRRQRPLMSEDSSSLLSSPDSKSSEKLHFALPTTTLNNSFSDLLAKSSASNININREQSTTDGAREPTATASLASSGFYYETNRGSVKMLMERLANTMVSPEKLSHQPKNSNNKISKKNNKKGCDINVSGTYIQPQQHQPRSILKGGRNAGRSFTFHSRPAQPADRIAAQQQQHAKLSQLISLGYQLK